MIAVLALGTLLLLAGASSAAALEPRPTETHIGCDAGFLGRFNCEAVVTEVTLPPPSPSVNGFFPRGTMAFLSSRPQGTFQGTGLEPCLKLVEVGVISGPFPLKTRCDFNYFPEEELGVHHLTGNYVPNPGEHVFELEQLASSGTTDVDFRAFTVESLECTPAPTVKVRDVVNCKVTIFHAAPPSQSARVPSGVVQFNSSNQGDFSTPTGTCTLAPLDQQRSSCELTYVPTTGIGSHVLTASYAGDDSNEPASATQTIEATVTRFAGPQGTGAVPCEDRANPCNLAVAATNQIEAGDDVVVEPGNYFGNKGDFGAFQNINVRPGVLVHGEADQPRPVLTATSQAVPVSGSGSVSRIELESKVAPTLISIFEGTIDGVVARSSAPNATVCQESDGTIRNTACLSSGAGSSALGLRSFSERPNQSFGVFVRNVTAVSTGSESFGLNYRLESESFPGAIFVNAKGVIAHGTRTDVVANAINLGGVSGTSVLIDLDHSDYATRATLVNAGGGTVTVTAPGTGTNITDLPLLAADGYHEQANAPTVDIGAVDTFNSDFDIDGQARKLGPEPDIGADESDAHLTVTSVECEPSALEATKTTNCTATIKDANGLLPALDPPTDLTGRVHFESDSEGFFSGGGNCRVEPTVLGEATCSVIYVPSEPIGNHKITAKYQGDETHRFSQKTTEVTVEEVVVPLRATETSLECSPPSVRKNDTSNCTVTVNDTDASPTAVGGEIELSSDSPGSFGSEESERGICVLAATGTGEAACNVVYKPSEVGAAPTHSITATYLGDETHGLSHNSFELTVTEKAQTKVALSCRDSALQAGQSTTCVARIKDKSTVAPTVPGGEVQFDNGGAPGVFIKDNICQAQVRAAAESSCEVTYKTSAAGSGVHKITATYVGDETHEEGRNQAEITVTEAATPLHPTKTSLSCVNPQLQAGQSTRCTATVKDESAGPSAPSGEVHFLNNGAAGAFVEGKNCPLSSKSASEASCDVTYKASATGTVPHVLTGIYQGDPTHGASESAPLTITVTEAPVPLHKTKATLTCQDLELLSGQTTHCTVTVKDESTSNPRSPSGEVQFTKDNSPGVFTEGSVCTLESRSQARGVCEIAYKANAKGLAPHELTAAYKGDATHGVSEGSVEITVSDTPIAAHETKTTLTCRDAQLVAGQSTLCTAAVQDESNVNSSAPSGEVTFTNHGAAGSFTENSPCLLEAGVAAESTCKVTYKATAPGGPPHVLTAKYQGDNKHLPSEGSTTVAVTAIHGTTTDVKCNPSTFALGNHTDCTVTVKDTTLISPGAPGGEVQFERIGGQGSFEPASANNKCKLAVVSSASSACTITFNPSVAAAITIKASYPGDTGHDISNGSTPLTVNAPSVSHGTSTEISCNPSTLSLGDHTECEVKVEDIANTNRSAPGGDVQFERTAGQGAFEPANGKCTLSPDPSNPISTCKVTFKPSAAVPATIKASYPGDGGHDASSESTSLTVNAETGSNGTSTEVSCSPPTLALGNHSECEVTVRDIANTGASAPKGEVRFEGIGVQGAFEPATKKCKLETVTGTPSASCTITFKPSAVGAGTIKAIYPGENGHEASNGSTPLTVTAATNTHGTSTEVSCDPSPVALGNHTECAVTVSDIANANRSAPGGEVQFERTAGQGSFEPVSGKCTLNPGVGTNSSCTVVFKPGAAGAVTIKAQYLGTQAHETSSQSIGLTVTGTPPTGAHGTSTAVNCSPSSLALGNHSECEVTVKDIANAGAASPGGEVQFELTAGQGAFEPASANNKCKLVPGIEAGSSCTIVFNPSAVGAVTVKASYPGETGHEDSSKSTSLTVTPTSPDNSHGTSTNVKCNPDTFPLGNHTECEVTVKDIANASPSAPGGEVRFDGIGVQGEFEPASGRCKLEPAADNVSSTCTIAFEPGAAGGAAIKASYLGEAGHEASSKTIPLTVTGTSPDNSHATASELKCNPASVGLGDHTKCKVTVKDIANTGANAPQGEVRFEAISVPGGFEPASGKCALNPGVGSASSTCTIVFKPSAVSTGTISASYLGETGHESSDASTPLSATAATGSHGTTTEISCNPASLPFGNHTRCAVKVEDLANAGASAPRGDIAFESIGIQGAFQPGNSCTLAPGANPAISSCSIVFNPGAVGVGTIKASYPGENGHDPSSEEAPLTVTAETASHGTSTEIACNPATFALGNHTRCTATVEDVANDGAAAPQGEVKFERNGAPGSFEPTGKCVLSSVDTATSSCSVTFKPSAVGVTTTKAGYLGENGHEASSESTSVTITAATANHGTATDVKCIPASLALGNHAECKVTVEDIANTGAAGPRGDVSFEAIGLQGAFEPAAANSKCTLAAGANPAVSSCSIVFNPGAVGAGTIKAGYPGENGHDASSESTPLTVTAATGDHGTAANFSCDPASLALGGTTECTVTERDTSNNNPSPPQGDVIFDNSGVLGSFEPAAANGKCTLATVAGTASSSCTIVFNPSAVGAGTIIANYPGENGREANISNAPLTVTSATPKQQTVNTVKCEPSPVILDGAAACTVTVEGVGDNPTAPAGGVEFSSDSQGSTFSDQGQCTLFAGSGAKASCQIVYFPSAVVNGTTITAAYQGDNDHEAKDGTTQISVVGHNGGHATATTLTCQPPAGVVLGGSAVCTAAVKDTAANPVAPGGGVILASNGPGEFSTGGCILHALGAPGESRCQVVYTPREVGSGSHEITAIYPGETGHEPSRGSAPVAVLVESNGHDTETKLACQPGAVSFGDTSTCTATVIDLEGAVASLPTGPVIFATDSAGTFASGGCNLAQVGTSNKEASCTIAYVPSEVGNGPHQITALYNGDAGHKASRFTAPVTVTAHGSATTLACAPASIVLGAAPTTCTATVADTTAKPTAPTGTVKFSSDPAGTIANNGACTLADVGGGKASCQITYTPTALGSGIHKLTAAYQGDAKHGQSQGQAQVQVAPSPVAPNTTLKRKPAKKSRSRIAKFTFVSDQPGSTFLCKLDRKPFKKCRSPFKARVKPGRHVFQVKAVSPTGISDPSPVRFRWTVGKVAKKHR
jgi:hypothetical protein